MLITFIVVQEYLFFVCTCYTVESKSNVLLEISEMLVKIVYPIMKWMEKPRVS